MRIGQRQIGPDEPPYVIAELGVNHDGSVEQALELVRIADLARADAIKLQLFRTDLLMSRAAKLAAYQKEAGETDPIAMLRRLELSVEQMRPIVELARDLGMHVIATVFSVELVAEAERLVASSGGGFDAYKTASPDIINRPLLEALAATGRPLILSTGAATLDEVERAIGWLAAAADRLAVLQCVSAYPTAPEQAELGGIGAIREVFGGPVGYSDHTPAIETGWMAVACGAMILEKHLTYDRRAPGPDHAASLEGDDFRRYVMNAKLRFVAAKGGCTFHTPYGVADPEPWMVAPVVVPRVKRVLEIERDVRRVSRQSLTTVRTIAAGHTLARGDLTIKRPGTGIEPWRLDEVVGRRAVHTIEADMPLTEEDLA